MVRSPKGLLFFIFKELDLDKNHPIHRLQRNTRAELPKLQKFSCLSFFKNYINTLAQIDRLMTNSTIPSGIFQLIFNQGLMSFFFFFLKDIFFLSGLCSQPHSNHSILIKPLHHLCIFTSTSYQGLSSLHTIVFSLKAYQENQLLHMKVIFCSLKEIKTLLKPFMSSALPSSYRLLLSFFTAKSSLAKKRT